MRLFFSTLLGSLLLAGVAEAQRTTYVTSTTAPAEREWGIGLVASDDLNLSLQSDISARSDLEFRLGLSGLADGALMLAADYNYDLLSLTAPGSAVYLPIYVGFGLQSGIDAADQFGFGLTAQAGISAELAALPLEIFAEIEPRLMLTSPTGPALVAALGARVVF